MYVLPYTDEMNHYTLVAKRALELIAYPPRLLRIIVVEFSGSCRLRMNRFWFLALPRACFLGTCFCDIRALPYCHHSEI